MVDADSNNELSKDELYEMLKTMQIPFDEAKLDRSLSCCIPSCFFMRTVQDIFGDGP